MKATVALILAATTAMVGCTRVVERQVPVATPAPNVVSTPAIVERTTTQQPAAGATAAPACTWASQTYSTGATSCQNHANYRCNNGTWEQVQAAPAC
jgi:hypothetical protein